MSIHIYGYIYNVYLYNTRIRDTSIINMCLLFICLFINIWPALVSYFIHSLLRREIRNKKIDEHVVSENVSYTERSLFQYCSTQQFNHTDIKISMSSASRVRQLICD